ncbi:MAG: glycine oxidase [Thermoleophilaceae bacterium]|nr:glycine oxidase [Thermoleophilaceae bacterium]
MAQHKGHDVVVVGAGVIGLACAWRCAQRGLTVLVVEREADAGAGASGVAAGMLAPVTEAEFGEEPLLRLNLAGAEMWPAFAAELAERSGLDTGYRSSGALVVAADRDDAEELRRLHAFQQSLGLDVRWLSGRECRRLEPRLSPRVPGGILADHDHQVEPRAVVRALRAAFGAAGGELRCGTLVEDLAELEADQVVVAAGCWSGEFGLPVRPVKGQILRLRGGPLAERLVRTPRCYVVSRPDGEVVVGATVEERGFDTTVTADGVFRLLEAAREVLPDVAELEFAEAAARLRPGTPDNAPLIGAHEGVVWATGHHRNGVLLAPITAAAVAAMVSGEPPPQAVEPFEPGRFARAAA